MVILIELSASPVDESLPGILQSLRMSSSIEDALSCHICAEIFKDPVQFPCTHSLCNSCLKHLLESSVGTVLQCPECKDVIQERFIRKNDLLASIVDFYWEVTARADSDAKLMIQSPSGTRINQQIPHQNLQDASQGDGPKDSQCHHLPCDNSKPDHNDNSSDAKSAISKEQESGNPKIVVTDTEQLGSQSLEDQFKQLKQVHYQREMQQQHLQRRLRDLQSQLQVKRFTTKTGQRFSDQPNETDTCAQILSHFEQSLGQYAQYLKDFHEQQLKSLQVEATKAALQESNHSPRTARNKRNKDADHKPNTTRSPKISRMETREPTREQLGNKIQKLQQTFEQSQQQQQEMWTQLQSMKQSQQRRFSDSDAVNEPTCDYETEKDLLMFEAKFRQYEKLQLNLHNMKVDHLKDKINKMQ